MATLLPLWLLLGVAPYVTPANPPDAADCCVRRVYDDGGVRDLPKGCRWCPERIPEIDGDRTIAPCNAQGGIGVWSCKGIGDEPARCECTEWQIDSCTLVGGAWWTELHCIRWTATLEKRKRGK